MVYFIVEVHKLFCYYSFPALFFDISYNFDCSFVNFIFSISIWQLADTHAHYLSPCTIFICFNILFSLCRCRDTHIYTFYLDKYQIKLDTLLFTVVQKYNHKIQNENVVLFVKMLTFKI